MAKTQEPEVKAFFKLGTRATIFFDKSQSPPNKIVGKQVIELEQTEAVENALTFKHIVPAKDSEVKAYQKMMEERAAVTPVINLEDVKETATALVTQAETQAQNIVHEAQATKTAATTEADKIVAEAKKEATQILKDAKVEAAGLTGKAKTDAADILKAAKDEVTKNGNTGS